MHNGKLQSRHPDSAGVRMLACIDATVDTYLSNAKPINGGFAYYINMKKSARILLQHLVQGQDVSSPLA